MEDDEAIAREIRRRRHAPADRTPGAFAAREFPPLRRRTTRFRTFGSLETDEGRPTGRVRALGAGPPGDPREPSLHLETSDWSIDGTRHVPACVWL
jgi:hypothetical protein